MEFEITLGGRTHHVTIDASRGKPGWYRIALEDGRILDVEGKQVVSGEWRLRMGDRTVLAGAAVRGEEVALQIDGRGFVGRAVDARRAGLALGGASAEGWVTTQMPGVVVRTLVAIGAKVQKGDPVIVVEAMKMENELKAPVDGVVVEITVEPGHPVESGTALVRIDPTA
jgi:biotin carboxyl carrier protein